MSTILFTIARVGAVAAVQFGAVRLAEAGINRLSDRLAWRDSIRDMTDEEFAAGIDCGEIKLKPNKKVIN